jgi:hypothetical protein
MRPHLLPRLLLAGAALLPLAVAAEPIAYGVGFSDLYRVDLATGQASRVGAIGYNDVEGLALTDFGTLLGAVDGTAGAGGNSSDFLIRIDTSTGAGSLIGGLTGLAGAGPNGQLDYGLAQTCDGRLWLAAETTQELWELDRNTGTPRRVGSTGATISGLAARGGELYGVSAGATPSLYRIDTATATITLIGPLNAGGTINNVGLDFDASGNLWAVLDPNDVTPSRAARIDVATGRATVTASIGANIGFKGLAISPVGACQPGAVGAAPVPVPAPGLPALLLLGLAALGFGARALRRRAQ